MGEVVYRSEVIICRDRGPLRHAHLPATDDPVEFGVHSAIAEHYGVTPEREVAATLDYIVAAAGG
jgi:hypothetical protein